MNRLLLAFALVAPLAVAAQTGPILRTEVGGHAGPVWDIATDASGRHVVTAGDKTVRVWDARTGELLEVLRPPIGYGREGSLGGVAISPDGKRIATGGFTRREGETSHSFYVFERPGGKLIARRDGFQGQPFRFAYSRDARYLAAMAIDGVIKVYRSEDLSVVAEDRACRGVGHLDIDRSNRLASVCFDGFVRSYSIESSGLRLHAQRKLPGERPLSVRFSPDGAKLAIGYLSTPARVDVLNAVTLERSFSPDIRGALGRLRVVSWSADGTQLYAGGLVSEGDRAANRASLAVRRWSAGGSGPFVDLPVGGFFGDPSTVLAIAAMPHGGILYGTFGAEWGRFDAGGRALVSSAAKIFIYGNTQNHDTRQELESALEVWAKSAPRYPQANAAGASVTQEGMLVTYNGRPLPLDPSEAASGVVTLSTDGETLFVPTGHYVRAYRPDGTELWKRQPGAAARSVEISNDPRYVAVWMSDGTKRWYRVRDGQEVLALFQHADGKRWVMWTPGGYYMASAGAEELIGWHVNRGREDAGDFYPASRFRSQFYRPDVVARMLAAGDETEALRLANDAAGRKEQAARVEALLPPVVTVVSPEAGQGVKASPVKVRFTLRAPGDAPVTALRVRVNGQAVNLPDSRNLLVAAADGQREIEVPIPSQDSEIMLFAENRNGVSVPGVARVVWRAPRAEGFSVKPKLYVLAVGVSEYQLKEIRLGFAAKDARDFAAAVLRQKGVLYRDVEVKLLTDAAATRDEVVDGLEWIRRQVTSKDVGMVYLAGHGINDSDGKYYFLPVNVDPERLKRTAVVFSEIRDTLAALPGKAIFFVDTCHSGNVLGTGRRAAPVDVSPIVNELASAENGVLVFSASTGRQYSLENREWGNGAFTKAVIEGLLGRADFNKTGRITHKMLDFYISERVKELTGNKQTPVTLVPQGVPDFPIAVVK